MIFILFVSFFVTVFAEEQCSMQSEYKTLAAQYQEFLQEVATNQNECQKEKADIYQAKMECMARVTKYENIITNGLESKLNYLQYVKLKKKSD